MSDVEYILCYIVNSLTLTYKLFTLFYSRFVKEDLILPHHYTFYDLIVTKARGKSGPLFAFHALDDIRVTQDASKEKEDSHAGKVLIRTW